MRAARWILRFTVATQCLGNARWFLAIQETPLLAWLAGSPDVGGIGWSEGAALAAQQWIGWSLIPAAICILVRPCAWVLVPVCMLQVTIAGAMIPTHSGFQLITDWLPGSIAQGFPLCSQLARIAAPVGLLLMDPWRGKPRAPLTIQVLRWAIAITFFVHGIEAWQHYSLFVDFNIIAAQRVFDWEMSEHVSKTVLSVIGALDMMVAVVVLVTRWRWAAGYMVVWGLVTALSRIVVWGWVLGLDGFLTRAPHFGVPAVVLLAWHYATRSEAESIAE